MPGKKRRNRPSVPKELPHALVEGLAEAERLGERGRWEEARDILRTLERRYPNRPELLTELANACYELRDTEGYQRALERLTELRPNDPDLTLALAGATLVNGYPLLALRAFRAFADRWPEHDRAEDARETLSILEPEVAELLPQMGLSPEELELAWMHEDARVLLERGDYAGARKVERRLLRARPDFFAALNNISLSYAMEGRLDEAAAAARQVLDAAPDNVHALSNLVRFLCMGGRMDEAAALMERLRAIEPDRGDLVLKKAEALSYLGDDAGVIETFKAADGMGRHDDEDAAPLLLHLAAVAEMRQGREDRARRLWEQALEAEPGYPLAEQNLADLEKPVGERHAPWAFELGNWIPRRTIDDLVAQVGADTRQDDPATAGKVQRDLRRHPEVTALVPVLLERGDPVGREFALRIATAAGTPQLMEALRDFALSDRGPDSMRLQAANAAIDAGLMAPGPMRLWTRGERREVNLMRYELHDEPVFEHGPEAAELISGATRALREGDGAEAERLLRRALELEPDAPTIRFNLAVAHEAQGRDEEAARLKREVHEAFPDYLFGRTAVARMLAGEGRVEEARQTLEPLFRRSRFNYSEFAAFAGAQIEILLAGNEIEGARSWIGIWRSNDPDHPDIEHWERLVDERQGRSRGRRWLGWGR